MIVTFCGHAQFSKSKEYEQQILAFLEEKIGDRPADMYLGGYGDFDDFAHDCCKKFKKLHPILIICLSAVIGIAAGYLLAIPPLSV